MVNGEVPDGVKDDLKKDLSANVSALEQKVDTMVTIILYGVVPAGIAAAQARLRHLHRSGP